MEVGVVLAAAGSGRRMGGTLKQFLPLLGRPAYRYAAETFSRLPEVAEVVVVVPEARLGEVAGSLGDLEVPARALAGAERRQDSVRIGLEAITSPWVAVHDAARPCVHPEDIRAVLRAAERCGAAILARASTDSLKEVEGGRIVRSVPRDRVWRAETPQVFRASLLREAYARWKGGDATDDAALVEALPAEVAVVAARRENPKLTLPEDLPGIELLLGRLGAGGSPR